MLADDEPGAKREDPSIPLNPRYTAAFAAIEQDPNPLFAVIERDARRFYESLGVAASHDGMKPSL